MPMYDFHCERCGRTDQRFFHMDQDDEREKVACGICGDKMPQILSKGIPFKFGYTPGKETGVYEYDYGAKATHDLTVPGKMERLEKEGRINNPFNKK